MCIFWDPCGFFGIHVDFLRSMWISWDPCGFIEIHVDFSNRVDFPDSTWILNNLHGFSSWISGWIIHVDIHFNPHGIHVKPCGYPRGYPRG